MKVVYHRDKDVLRIVSTPDIFRDICKTIITGKVATENNKSLKINCLLSKPIFSSLQLKHSFSQGRLL